MHNMQNMHIHLSKCSSPLLMLLLVYVRDVNDRQIDQVRAGSIVNHSNEPGYVGKKVLNQSGGKKSHSEGNLNDVGSDDCKHLRWNTCFNSSLTYENSSIMVPKTGVYFVYVRFILGCEENNTDFHIKFESWNEAYPVLSDLTTAKWSLTCSSSHTVFIGELFELHKGDQLKVKVEKGCEVIRDSRFGAFSQ
uniref:THD domain-containing protein n=1 Tax=Oryzias sinensis TaxID=183150 RepID=A0A8C7Z4U1_9TELE